MTTSAVVIGWGGYNYYTHYAHYAHYAVPIVYTIQRPSDIHRILPDQDCRTHGDEHRSRGANNILY
jgi:hypothetical protein